MEKEKAETTWAGLGRAGPASFSTAQVDRAHSARNAQTKKKKMCLPTVQAHGLPLLFGPGRRKSPVSLNLQTLTGCNVLLCTRRRWLLPASIPPCSVHLPVSCGDRSREGTPLYHYLHATVNLVHRTRRKPNGIREAMASSASSEDPSLPATFQ